MPHYLVTGGCGFIGSHLIAALIAGGHEVRVLDDLSTGSLDNLPRGVELVEGDVADAAIVQRAMEGVNGCVHLAAIASVERGTQDWPGTHRVNLSGTIAVFDAARAHGRVPVVYASSAAVYGDPAALPITEDTPTRPLSAYGADKLGCEQHARVAGVVHGVPTLGLRFFNVFGPRQDPRSPYSGVISIFCDRLAAGEPVSVYGDGLQTRDFIYVEDVVAGLVAAIRAASTEAPVLNLCTGRATSILDLAGIIGRLCGTDPRPQHLPQRAGEIRESIGERTRAARLLALPEPRSLESGLAEVIGWMRAGRPGLRIHQPAG